MSNLKMKVLRTGLHLKKHLPTISTIGGVILGGASTVFACKATLKLEPVLDKAKTRLQDVKDKKEQTNEKEYTKELAKVYIKNITDISRLYFPSALMFATSTGLILGANSVHLRRNSALAAAYKVIEGGFSQYRERVIDELGEDKDREFRHGVKKETIEVDNPNQKSKKKKIKETITIVHDIDDVSMYARVFDEQNRRWENVPDYNYIFLKNAQDHANHKLQAEGHLFLNEIYDALGFRRTKEGAIVGWLWDPMSTTHDNQVIFDWISIKTHKKLDPSSIEDLDELRDAILIDFNVDGVIYDMI